MASMDLLSTPEGRAFAAEVARTHGLTPQQAEAAIRGLIPELVNGLERNTLSRGGIADLLKALATGDHERYLSAPNILGNPAIMADGQRILGHLFRSEGAAMRAARFVEGETGVSRSVLWQILPGVAALLIGWLARSAKGGLGDVLSKVPGAKATPVTPLPRPASPPASGGTIAFPPAPDLDKISPSPGPYGDLSDILRKGGGSGGLSGTIRDLLGGLLGFKSKGVVGWLIRLILVRYGWRILTWVVRRVFLGR
jgi:hypothetical protein